MTNGRLQFLALTLIAMIGCTKRDPQYCQASGDCPSGFTCDVVQAICVAPDAGFDRGADGGGSGGDGTGGSGDGTGGGADVPDGAPEVPVSCTVGSCDQNTPICDATSKVCRTCLPGVECSAANPATPACVQGRCFECAASTECATDAAKMICDLASHACRACSAGTECAARNPATPACVQGRCYECATSAECSATKPICDPTSHACRACSAGTECAARSAATPACVQGRCYECGTSAECSADATKSICDPASHTCRACSVGSECAARSAATPACVQGRCFECGTSAECSADATKPICDPSGHTCRTCQADGECAAKAGANPGICMAHQNGRCATPAEAIYVQNNQATCNETATTSDANAGTAAQPFCSMQPVLPFLSPTRDLIVVRGIVSGGTWTFMGQGAAETSIVGQQSAFIASAAAPAVSMQSGSVYIRGVKFSSSASNGISASGGTLRLDTVTVDSCMGGGILLDGAAFDIRNTTVTNNGPASFGVANWGGILVNTLPASGAKRLQLATIRNNKLVGLTCAGPIEGTGVFATGNVGGDVASSCNVTSCSPVSPNCGAQ